MKKTILLITLVALLGSALRSAETVLPRQGFVLGFAIGSGWLQIQEKEAKADSFRLALPNMKIGFMLSSRAALLVYIPTGIHTYQGKKRAFEALMVSLQYWLSERFWILTGAGVTLDFPLLFSSDSGFFLGPGFCVGSGFELIRKRHFALDIQSRLQYGRVKTVGDASRKSMALDLLIGCSWY